MRLSMPMSPYYKRVTVFIFGVVWAIISISRYIHNSKRFELKLSGFFYYIFIAVAYTDLANEPTNMGRDLLGTIILIWYVKWQQRQLIMT